MSTNSIIKKNKTYKRLGTSLFLFGLIELIISLSGAWCLIADGLRNMFAGFNLWITVWAFSIESQKDGSYQEMIKWSGRLYNGKFILVTHCSNVAFLLLSVLFAIIFGSQAYYDIEENIDGNYALPPSFEETSYMICLSLASIVVNVVNMLFLYKNGDGVSLLKSVALPVCTFISVLLVNWSGMGFFSHLVGLAISIVLLVEVFSLMKDTSFVDHSPQADLNGMTEYYREHPEEEKKYWAKIIGEEKVKDVIDPNTGIIDNEKLLTAVMGEEFMREKMGKTTNS